MNTQEQQYLDILKKIQHEVLSGRIEPVRDGHYRARIFGQQMRFDLNKGFPLLTHKKVFLRGIFEELMWFLRGQTDNKILQEKNVHIWAEWSDVLVPHGYESGELGAIYGESWRNFGEHKTELVDVLTDKSVQGTGKYFKHIEGFDQIEWVINEIKTNPASSRLIVTAWNPHVHCVSGKAALPPCHTLFQFFVKEGKLSCQLYQRSADVFLGVPFNIASYALLTHMVAQACDLDVGEFVWTGGDCHVYGNQVDFFEEVIDAETYDFPTLNLKKKDSIYDYEWSDIEIVNYQHGPKIEIPVSK